MLKYLNVTTSEGKTIIMSVVKHSLEETQILYDFGADIHSTGNGNWSLICEASENVTEFLQLFPFTEEDFLNVFECKTDVDKSLITQEILKFYPHYKQLLTLENVVLSPLKESCEVQLDLCLHYKDEFGLKADSGTWIDI